jgi:PKD repeat protein
MCTRLPIPFADSSKPVSKISQWQWIFDDGKDTTYTTYAPTITHEFTNYGIYNVKLIISAVVSGVNFLDSTVQTVNIRPTPLPGYTVPNTCLMQTSLFTDTSETYGEPITSWSWVFGEPASGVNNTSILTDPTHKYGTPGSYDVQLIVENQYGCIDSITKPIRIFSLPVARFDNSVVCQGDPTFFYDLSNPSDTAIQSWDWDFDVAALMLDKSTLQNPEYTYPNTGDYTVELIVKDYNGCYDTVDSTVRVNVTPLSAFRIIDNVDGMTG